MNLFEVLSHDERIIVFSNQGESIVITWNRSSTFQCWEVKGSEFEEFGIMTYGGDETLTYTRARIRAQEWFGRGIFDDR